MKEITCPECAQGKHDNCTSWALDEHDNEMPCMCACTRQGERMAAAQDRYNRAAHAMQSGVRWEHAEGSTDGNPKHLRVGVNSAHIATAALAGLLINRGLFTLEEYIEAQADEMEAEVKRYEDRINAKLGPGSTRVHLL